MATSPYDPDPPVDWYGGNGRQRSSRPSSPPSSSIFRSVLILINYFPSIEDIQTYGYTRVIDNALQEPTYGNPWLLRHVIFTIGETIRSNNLIRTTFEGVHETLVTKIFDTWHIQTLMTSSLCASKTLTVSSMTFHGMQIFTGCWNFIAQDGIASNMLKIIR